MSLDAGPEPLRKGAVIGGRYRVLRTLGNGGMGVVYEAEHATLGRRVAIKMLRPEATASPTLLARFFQEARSAASIGHRGIVDVFDLSQPGEQAFLVMEMLDGEELQDRIQRAPLAIPDVLRIGTELAEAIAAAHQHGIIHRDLKPQNVFLAKSANGEESVRVLDFGIAKLSSTDGADVPITKTGEIYGTPAYMAPEQIRDSRNIDGRVDVWAIGSILYEALSGSPPFAAPLIPDLIVKIVHERHTPLANLRRDVPEGLTALIERCLEKDPNRRVASAAELADHLNRLARGESLPARPPTPSIPDPTSSRKTQSSGRLGNAMTFLLVAVVCLAGGAFGYWLAFDTLHLGDRGEDGHQRGRAERTPDPDDPPAEGSLAARRDLSARRLTPLVAEVGARLDAFAATNGPASAADSLRAIDDLEIYLALTGQDVLLSDTSSRIATALDLPAEEGPVLDAFLAGDARLPRDDARVARARSILARETETALVLAPIRARCDAHAITIDTVISGTSSPFTAAQGVDGSYTEPCFREVAAALLDDAQFAERVRAALGSEGSTTAEALRLARNQYLRDYTEAWLAFVRSVTVNTATSLASVADLLAAVIGEGTPPTAQLFSAVEEHTALEVPEAVAARSAGDGWRDAEPNSDVHLEGSPPLASLGAVTLNRNDLRAAFEPLTGALRARGEAPALLDLHHRHVTALHAIARRRVGDPRSASSEDTAAITAATTEVAAAIEQQPEAFRARIHALLWPPIQWASDAMPQTAPAWYSQ